MPITVQLVETTTTLGLEVVSVRVVAASTPGPAGPGVPAGGTANQVLTKDSSTDYDTSWQDATGGGGGAPTDVDYLVGTASGDLSAEIVVGTSPGGELGGTWASPTVDATHSGSSHASVQAAAEATAAAALSAHLNDTTDAHDASAISSVAAGNLSSTDVQAALNELDSEKAATSHAHAGEDITSGTVADARIASTIARDSEVTSAIAALSSVYQAKDTSLDYFAGLDPAANVKSILESADYAAIRTLLGLVIGTNVQAYDADLTTWAGLTPSAFFQTLVDDADAATARATLGVIASLFQSGGAQAIKLDDLATPDDNTDLNASTSAHGLLKKLSNVATEYMDGTGSWSTPAGGSTDGWTAAGETLTYASATTFTVSGDQAAKYSKGTRIKLTQTTVKYFVVIGSSHSSGTTTVTITGGSDYSLANAVITSPFYSYAANPQRYPGWFNYAPTWSSSGTQPVLNNGTLIGQFAVVGIELHFLGALTMGSGTTYGTGTYAFSLPVAAALGDALGTAYLFDSSTGNFVIPLTFPASSTTLDFRYPATHLGAITVAGQLAPWTWAQGDLIRWEATYGI